MNDLAQLRYRALEVAALSDDFSGVSFVERSLPSLADDAVVMRVKAVALNYPDVLMTQGRYQFKPELPFVPGMESSGEVVAVGASVRAIKPGDRVVAMTRHGALSEYMVAREDEVRALPAALSWEQGAAFSVAGMTAYVALVNRGQLQPGETVLVHGASGGTGLAAVQLGKHLGAKVIATGRSMHKLQVARDAGADHLIELGGDLRGDLLSLTQGRGVDVVFDPIGGEVFDASLRSLAWGGRLLVVGFVSGTAGEVRANYALIKGISVVGVRAGEFARRDPVKGQQALQAVDELAAKGVLCPHISTVCPFDQAIEALRLLSSGAVQGKAVVTMPTLSAN